ncbi:hypothetical protein CLV59_102186 [Chitinophaga dinghuensis]|uniref:Uncharacterized protein n=1 Tax=Chitinophaga dinghuensis TaxID=1539050 RepID=A0A327W7X8_9BACT|nr:hypothetical protein CLV59_102186 [Chitinophaga dinghuensis]
MFHVEHSNKKRGQPSSFCLVESDLSIVKKFLDKIYFIKNGSK